MINNTKIQISIILIISFIVYLNAFQNDFTLDDHQAILENKDVTDGNIFGIFKDRRLGDKEATIRDVFRIIKESRGIRQLNFIMDYQLFGRNPSGYHVESAILHAVNSALLYELLLLLSLVSTSAFAASLIFAVHPVHVEAVASIANRKELLALLFVFLSVRFYIKAVNAMKGRKRSLFISFLFYLLATFSKQPAGFLIFVLIAYDHVFLNKADRVIGRIAIPASVAFLSLIVIGVAYPSFVNFYSNPDTMNIRYWHVVLTVIYTFFFDVRYLLFPFQLSADQTINIISSVQNLQFIISFFLLACYLKMMCVSFRHDKVLFIMLLWSVLFLLPTSNIIPGTSYFFAERYLYMPSVGYAAIMGRITDTIPGLSRKVSIGVLIFILLSFSCLTVLRNAVWQTEESLWRDVIKKSPRSVFGHNNVGNFAYLRGDYVEAAMEYDIVLRLRPKFPEGLYNMANTYYMKGDKRKALGKYKEFLEVWKGDEGIRSEVSKKIMLLDAELKGINR